MLMQSMVSARALVRAVPIARQRVLVHLNGRGFYIKQAEKLVPLNVRFNGSSSTPLGLKEGTSTGKGLSPTMRLLFGYVSVSLVAMITIARYKDRDTADEESARVFNMAKRAVVKDRRFFEAVGYPKDFQQIGEEEVANTEGSFRVIGDKANATVFYKQLIPTDQPNNDDDPSTSSSDSIMRFERLEVKLDDGTRFSALESFLSDASVASQRQSESLGKKLFFPVIGGVLLGGIASFFAIRIIRNRPYYVHKLVLDHVNNNNMARQMLGHPIKSNRKDYIGKLTSESANYSISCKGPKGEGTLIVKAYKASDDVEQSRSDEIMATPGTAWRFSTLMLMVKRNENRKEKAKNAKTINLLADGTTPTN